jgi:hypothetical protein
MTEKGSFKSISLTKDLLPLIDCCCPTFTAGEIGSGKTVASFLAVTLTSESNRNRDFIFQGDRP